MIKGYEFTNEGTRVWFEGLITSAEILEANTKSMAHENYAQSKYHLWFFENVEDFVISTRELQKIVEQEKISAEQHPDKKIAIVTDSPLGFGLARMYDAFSVDSKWETGVFRTLAEAEQWLDS